MAARGEALAVSSHVGDYDAFWSPMLLSTYRTLKLLSGLLAETVLYTRAVCRCPGLPLFRRGEGVGKTYDARPKITETGVEAFISLQQTSKLSASWYGSSSNKPDEQPPSTASSLSGRHQPSAAVDLERLSLKSWLRTMTEG